MDPDLEMIILKCLQKPADLRYQSAARLADDLEAYLANESISARSSRFNQIVSRAFRATHNASVLENWGLLWMLHAAVLLVLCLVTNYIHYQGEEQRWPYLALWTVGLGAWAFVFWNLRHRGGPVTFVERQIAHVWAGSMACSTLLYLVEAILNLPVLTLSPNPGATGGNGFSRESRHSFGRILFLGDCVISHVIGYGCLSRILGRDFRSRQRTEFLYSGIEILPNQERIELKVLHWNESTRQYLTIPFAPPSSNAI